MSQPDVLIVGAGLAGLTCARYLQKAGLSFRIFEKSDKVGGRVRTDYVDGFLLDRGFQVFLTGYPEAKKLLNYDRLNLRTFYDGALIRYQGAFHRVADPIRHPLDTPGMLFSPVTTFGDKLKVARMRYHLLDEPLDKLFEREEKPTFDALVNRWGYSKRFIDSFFRPFLGGVLFDPELQSSSRISEFVLRMFSSGHAALPAAGMGSISEQLAAGLPDQSILLNATVRSIDKGAIVLESGSRYEARVVVIATDAPEAETLVPSLSSPGSRAVTCLYYSTSSAPFSDPILVLNGEGTGPVNNLAVLTNVAPTYARDGQALVSVVVIGNPLQSDANLESEVRRQLMGWYGADVQHWRHLRTYRILDALPDQTPPFLTPPERPVRLFPGLYVCGDHRRNGSLNGAMVSGRHAAETIVQDLKTVL